MRIKFVFITAAILSFAAAAFGQTRPAEKAAEPKLPPASEVLSRYVDAIGGREASEKIKSRRSSGTVELSPVGIKGEFEQLAAAPDLTYTKLTLAGIGEMLEGYDGKSAWTVNPIQGSRDRTGAELKQAQLVANFHRDINLSKLYSTIDVKGIEKIGTADAYVVHAKAEGLDTDKLYFDVKSGLMLRSDTVIISPEGSQPATTYYEDYRKVDGIMIPHRTRTQMPQFEIVMNIEKIEHGVDAKPEAFAKPAS